MTDPIRLAKRVAELRACSRREAEQLNSGGWVRVNGVVVEEPQARVADERIEIDPKADISQAEPVTLLLHKPPGYHAIQGSQPAAQLLIAANRWAEDESGVTPLKKHFTQLTACVPLELDASGLVVFTQDWHVSRKLSEDATMIEHEMIVEVSGEMIPHALKRLNLGIPFNGRTPTAIKVSWQNETRLRVALKGAQIGQIAHLCEAVGLQVVSMKRIRLGGVSLGKVPPGQWRYLRMDERF
ncbi:MAG TPA: rRNA pseudouridine synthase [Thiobacillus sp.]|nr:MAG: RNA-binding protein [Hydrogenophilales bacterium 28-61-11]OYZ56631.1 MAG: RNA-binding protein [Hydrogenophilales bacterium 16-61-112]OZA41811.1 MAG: RNA-binding protein [Hydrogenophilales bacterium 17-61-76]HQT32204.1 rRNA pseudouridine synthase [Thiobacillus sp.]HQT70062.1 rRNA pseudouridine synthase [Thiobacillus sp.]